VPRRIRPHAEQGVDATPVLVVVGVVMLALALVALTRSDAGPPREPTRSERHAAEDRDASTQLESVGLQLDPARAKAAHDAEDQRLDGLKRDLQHVNER
jgi:hypothetical protein